MLLGSVNRMKYQGNNPKRRVAKHGYYTAQELAGFAAARYQGIGHHKTKPADYGLDPPVAPRPSKSVCDDKRIVKIAEAVQLFRAGVCRGLVSTYMVGEQSPLPKYAWAVDEQGEVYEAKLGGDMRSYHGYRLREDERAMREWVIQEWKERQV